MNAGWDVYVLLENGEDHGFKINAIYELNDRLWRELDTAFPNGRADIKQIEMH